jgi:hypothetical protein
MVSIQSYQMQANEIFTDEDLQAARDRVDARRKAWLDATEYTSNPQDRWLRAWIVELLANQKKSRKPK